MQFVSGDHPCQRQSCRFDSISRPSRFSELTSPAAVDHLHLWPATSQLKPNPWLAESPSPFRQLEVSAEEFPARIVSFGPEDTFTFELHPPYLPHDLFLVSQSDR